MPTNDHYETLRGKYPNAQSRSVMSLTYRAVVSARLIGPGTAAFLHERRNSMRLCLLAETYWRAAVLREPARIMAMSASLLGPPASPMWQSASRTAVRNSSRSEPADRPQERRTDDFDHQLSRLAIAERVDVVICLAAKGMPLLGRECCGRHRDVDHPRRDFRPRRQCNDRAADKTSPKTMDAVRAKRKG